MLEDDIAVSYKRIVIKCGYTDLRCGISSLSVYLSMLYGVNWKESNEVLYLFCGRSCRKIKGLIHTKNGFLMMNILLEKNSVKWPRKTDELKEITEEQLKQLLAGEKIF